VTPHMRRFLDSLAGMLLATALLALALLFARAAFGQDVAGAIPAERSTGGAVESVDGEWGADPVSRSAGKRRAGGRPAPIHLHHARMSWLECSPLAHPDCYNDAAAIWGTSREALGADATVEQRIEHLKRYTKLYTRRTARALEIASWPDDDIPGKSARFNATWRRWRAHAGDIIAGKVRTPCPGARHWGGPRVDVIPPSMEAVECRRATRNVFLRMR